MPLQLNVPLEFDGLNPVTFYLVFDTGESKILVGDVYTAMRLMLENKPIIVTILPGKARSVIDEKTKMMIMEEIPDDEFKRIIETKAEIICINPAAIKFIKST